MAEKKKESTCYFCERALTLDEAEDLYCFGCKELVCDDCDQTNVMGPHEVREHEEGED